MYWQAKWNVAEAVAKVKAWTWESREAMENNVWMASRRFWSTIGQLRRGKQCTINTVYSGDGMLLTLTLDVVCQRKKYFLVLNSTYTFSNGEAELGDFGMGSHILQC